MRTMKIFFVKLSFFLLLNFGDGLAQNIPGVYPQGSLRTLTFEELQNLSDTDLAILRNEIFARKGYDFTNTKYKTYFSRQAWYKPIVTNPEYWDNSLTAIEKQNVELVKAIEVQRSSNITSVETGINLAESHEIRELRTEAKEGNPIAQFELAEKYFNGNEIQQDYSQAFAWCRISAEQNYIPAITKLGVMYYYGYGVQKDYDTAARLFFNAAENDWEEAQYDLATMYLNGQGVNNDHKLAVNWLKKSADKNYTNAQYLLGLAYETGDGDSQNTSLAADWFRKAAANGHKNAQTHFDAIKNRIIAEDNKPKPRTSNNSTTNTLIGVAAVVGALWIVSEAFKGPKKDEQSNTNNSYDDRQRKNEECKASCNYDYNCASTLDVIASQSCIQQCKTLCY